MIVPMKKATIIIQSGDAEATIQHLRTMGVMQVEHQNLPEGSDIAAVMENVAMVNSSLDILNQLTAQERGSQPQKEISGDWTATAHHIIELGRQQEQLESSSGNLITTINEWERWGDIDSNQVTSLVQNGVYLKLYRVPVKELHTFPDDVVVKTLSVAGDNANAVVLSLRQFECRYQEIIPPGESVSLFKSRLSENNHRIDAIKGEIRVSACFYEALSAKKRELEKEIEFLQVLNGMGREGPISFVSGYIPFDSEERLEEEARSHMWGILIDAPSDDDNVPTLVRNPGWVTLIHPVLGFLGLSPGYNEIDISTVFLIFFSIFFGILIGDAGYGLVYIIITVLITFWLKNHMMLDTEKRTLLSLFYLLGSCAVIWGLLTGTFFGQGWLHPLVPQLNDPVVMQTFCFFLGAFHLSIAHTWRAYLKFPSLTAVADIGYILIIWTAFFIARTLVLGEPFPPWGVWLVAVGVILVILFTSPRATRVLFGIGEGVGTVALSFMNNITDVISYVRLFAVGLAGLAIAETTNFLASGFYGNGVLALAAGIVILITGHGLNIILGIISVLVHGVRLNVLEFSGHANVSWSGSPFKPFEE